MNALGIYLLVCLFFVTCALVEFAIVVLLYQRNNSKDVRKSETGESRSNEKENKSPLIPNITKIGSVSTQSHLDTQTLRTATNGNDVSRLVTKIRKEILVIPRTEVIDFIAVWFYLILFLVFNCIYRDYVSNYPNSNLF